MYTRILMLWLLPLLVIAAPPEGEKKAKPEHWVEVLTLQTETQQYTDTFIGELKARRIWRGYTLESGLISQLPYYEGDSVKAGAVLLVQDTRRLHVELDKAQAQRKQLESELKRAKNLGRDKLLAEEQLQQLATRVDIAKTEEQLLQIRLQDSQLTAPFSGIVSARLREPGDAVAAHTHALTLYAADSLVVESRLPEQTFVRLAPDLAVSVHIDALGNDWPGRVKRLHPDLESHQGIVEVQFDNPPAHLRPGMFCRLTLTTASAPLLSIPYTALQRDRAGEYVFIVEDGKAKRVTVTSGQQFANNIQIQTGVTAGQPVVIKGFLKLKDGMAVSVSN